MVSTGEMAFPGEVARRSSCVGQFGKGTLGKGCGTEPGGGVVTRFSTLKFTCGAARTAGRQPEKPARSS